MLLVSGHCANGCGIVYMRDELLALSKPPPFTVTGRRYQILEKLRRRNRRCRAGVMRKARRRRDQLMELKPAGLTTVMEDIPADHRGCRGKGSLRRRKGAIHCRLMERKTYKPCLPSLIMGNVRSLGNKMDELAALTRSHREYQECSLMIFSESWLQTDVPDHNVSTEGFHTVRADSTAVLF